MTCWGQEYSHSWNKLIAISKKKRRGEPKLVFIKATLIFDIAGIIIHLYYHTHTLHYHNDVGGTVNMNTPVAPRPLTLKKQSHPNALSTKSTTPRLKRSWGGGSCPKCGLDLQPLETESSTFTTCMCHIHKKIINPVCTDLHCLYS